jgi:hypothetical protein
MKNAVFWDVTPYGSCKNRLFGGTYRLHHQGDKYFFKACFGCWLLLTLFLARRFYHPDDGGDKFLRNVGSYKGHMS